MKWERPLLAVAAAYNAAWAVVLLLVPERVFVEIPPYEAGLAVLVGLVGACFAVNVVRPAPRLLAIGLLAKLAGPFLFVAAVHLGYLSASARGLTIVNDVLWIPPLVVLLRRAPSW